MFSHSKPGVVLISALYTLGLMSVLLVGLVMVVITELQIVDNYKGAHLAFLGAQSGVEDGIHFLQSNSAWTSGFSNKAGPSGSGYTYTVTVQNNDPFVTLVSTGQASVYSKTVRATVMVMGSPSTTPYRVRIDRWEEL